MYNTCITIDYRPFIDVENFLLFDLESKFFLLQLKNYEKNFTKLELHQIRSKVDQMKIKNLALDSASNFSWKSTSEVVT